jgi:hypothetical protein
LTHFRRSFNCIGACWRRLHPREGRWELGSVEATCCRLLESTCWRLHFQRVLGVVEDGNSYLRGKMGTRQRRRGRNVGSDGGLRSVSTNGMRG